MDFTLSKEQRDIVRASRKFALGEFPDRALEFDREETFDLELWRKACELGFVGVFIDSAYGGAGMGFLEHCLINRGVLGRGSRYRAGYFVHHIRIRAYWSFWF